MPRDVLILSTGGTIEKSYCESEGSLSNRSSQLKDHLLRDLRLPTTRLSVHEIMAKDSLDMTEEDRDIIAREIRARQRKDLGLIVLHGTDTMDKTLARVTSHVGPGGFLSPVVFTGAMRPATLVDSDARQNFIEALLLCQILPPGAYLSFHSQVFLAPWVAKNRDTGTFEPTDAQADLKTGTLLELKKSGPHS
jgi:L-asparaginase